VLYSPRLSESPSAIKQIVKGRKRFYPMQTVRVYRLEAVFRTLKLDAHAHGICQVLILPLDPQDT
jgi:hypothetical protein